MKLGTFNPDYSPKLLPVDTDLHLRIEKAELKQKPGVSDRIMVILEDPTDPEASPVFANFWLPGPNDTPRQSQDNMKKITDFFAAAGLPTEGDLTDEDIPRLEGQELWVVLRVGSDQNGNETREVKSFAAGY